MSSNIHATVPLLFLYNPSLMPVSQPKVIAFVTALPWSCDHMLLITHWSSDSNVCNASCNVLGMS